MRDDVGVVWIGIKQESKWTSEALKWCRVETLKLSKSIYKKSAS